MNYPSPLNILIKKGDKWRDTSKENLNWDNNS